jgi:hypothetical protein
MNYDELLKLSSTILASLGGGTLLLYAISGWLSRVWADKLSKRYMLDYDIKLSDFRNNLLKDMEKVKDKINKSNILFSDYINATKDIVKIYREIYPRLNYPDKDWHDACIDVAESSGKIRNFLEQFELNYGHILSTEEMTIVSKILSTADELNFELIDDYKVTNEGIKKAESILSNLEKIRSLLRDKFLSMVET